MDAPAQTSCSTRDACGRFDPAVLLLLLLCAATFWNSLPGQYCYDDTSAIRDRKTIESLSGLPLLVSREYCPAFGELTYRPVVSLTYFVDAMVFHKSPTWSRLINIVLHAAIGVALYGLWRRVFPGRRLAFVAAALFLCHPLATEVVNCPGFREDQLALLLMVTCLHLLVSAARRPTTGRLLAVPAVWFFALLAKEPAFMLVLVAPLLLLRTDTAVRQTWSRRHWITLRMATILAATAYAVLYHTLSRHGETTDWPEGGPLLGLLNFFRTFVVYLRLWILPVGLSVGHEFHVSTQYSDVRLWVSFLAWAAFAAASANAWKLRWVTGIGLTWVVVTMVPMMQLLPSPERLAERYTYIPHVGMSLAMAAGLLVLADRFVRPALDGGAVGRSSAIARAAQALPFLMIAGCMLCTLARNRDWSDEVTLNIRRYELWKSAEGHLALGSLYFDRRDGPRAVEHLRAAVAMNPKLAEAHFMLGVVYYQTGHVEDARTSLSRSVELDPDNDRYRKALEKLNAARPD